jgi:exodeoxyribonuclease III
MEGRVLTLEYESFFLVNVYCPNAGRSLERLAYKAQQYSVAFNKHIEDLLGKKQVVVFGDMNVAHREIDLSNPEANRNHAGFTAEERGAFSKLLGLGLRDTYRELHPERRQYTYWSNFSTARERNIGWRLDYLLASRSLALREATIHEEVRGSDHCPVSAVLEPS